MAAALTRDKASHQANLVELQQREDQVALAARKHREWVLVTNTLTQFPEKFELTSEGGVRLTVAAAKSVNQSFVAMVNAEPPEWVKSVVKQQHKLAATLARAAQKETEAGKTVAELSDILMRAGSILTPEQQPTASEANKAIRQYGMLPGGMER
ncbi:MAG: hypothetical protein KKE69_09555 [Alphaproteobacteria bacterium]|nr:hypothetical protein [Alphaproteobacteria bacterium]MBU1607692.1 hypothetical protein [Alphaproteobacteria bacterium]